MRVLGLAGSFKRHPPYGPDSANLNLVLRQTPSDPVSGSSPLRASGCDVVQLGDAAAAGSTSASARGEQPG